MLLRFGGGWGVGNVDPVDDLPQGLARWLREKYGVETTAVETFLSFLVLRAELVDVRSEIRLCRDPQDDKFLQAAVDGGADRLVSGDSDLLAVGSIEGVAIVDSASFLDAIE